MILSQAPDGTLLSVKPGTPVKAHAFHSEFSTLVQVVKDGSQAGPEAPVDVAHLRPPFASLKAKSLGFGLTYADHAQDVDLKEIVLFEKNAAPTALQEPVRYRDYLDYEAEVGLLLHRGEPALFGYYIHNDLTDRMVQATLFTGKNAVDAFSKAKSFPGSSGNSPLLVIGDASVWKSLRIELLVNGEKRQTVNPELNALSPAEIHKRVFARGGLAEGHDWVIVGTGTPSGTIFFSPPLLKKLSLLIKNGFSRKKAGAAWVREFTFLKKGDALKFQSAVLGDFETKIQ